MEFPSNFEVVMAEVELDRLIAAYRRYLELRPQDVSAWCQLGAALERQGQTTAAAVVFQQARDLEAGPAWAWYLRSVEQLFQGHADEAVRAQHKARQLAPDETTESLWASLNLSFCRQGTPNAVAEVYRKILEASPEEPGMWCQLGSTLERQGDPAEATRAFRQALELQPAEVAAWQGLIRVLRQQGDADAELEAHRRLLALVPTDAPAWYQYGVALGWQNQIESEVAAYRRALALNPTFALAWNKFSLALAKQGDAAGECEAYRRYLALQPESEIPPRQLELFGGP